MKLKYYIAAFLFILFSVPILSAPPNPVGPGVNHVFNAGPCWDSNDVNTPYVFENLTIQSGTLTVCGTGNLYIKVKENFTVMAGATIDLQGRGDGSGAPSWLSDAGYTILPTIPGQAGGTGGASGPGGPSPGWCPDPSGTPGGAGSAGGQGGNGGGLLVHGTSGNNPAGSGAGGAGGTGFWKVNNFCIDAGFGSQPGGAGGTGGTGGSGGVAGGLLYIEARVFENNGTIDLSGTDGINGTGGSNGTAGSGTGGGGIGPEGQGYGGGANKWYAGGGGGGRGAGGGGGGGGGGGVLFTKAQQIVNAGVINANGGSGATGGNGGNGTAGGAGTPGLHSGFEPFFCLTFEAFCSNSGGGGGAGGAGGNGADGRPGLVVFQYKDPVTNTGTLNPAATAQPEMFNPLQIGNINFESYFNSNQVINGWLNNRAVTDVTNGNVNPFISIDEVRINQFDSKLYIRSFDVDQVYYQYFDLSNTQVGGTYYLFDNTRRLDGTGFDSSNYFWYNPNVINISNQNPNNLSENVFDFSTLPDGVNTLRISAQTRAGTIVTKDHPLRIDLNAPCNQAADNCIFAINGASAQATNSPALKLFSAVEDGQGSQLVITDGMEVRHRFAGNAEPAGSDLYADFPLAYNDLANNARTDYNAVYDYILPGSPPDEGWYVVCARYRDLVGNITSLNHSGFMPNPLDFNQMQGNIPWLQSAGNIYGNTKVCDKINLDLSPPGAPQQLYLTVSDSGGPDAKTVFQANSNTYTFTDSSSFTSPNVYNPANISWTKESVVRARWQHPPNPVPGSPIDKGFYFISDNYSLPSGAPSTAMADAASGSSAVIQTDATGPFIELSYDGSLFDDGCKNVYLWLSDLAGNKSNIDGSFDFNTAVFCFDKVAPFAPSGVKFYSLKKLQEAGQVNIAAKTINLESASHADLANNSSSQAVTNKKDDQGDDDQIIIIFNQAEDQDPPAGDKSGLDLAEPYKICWDSTSGQCNKTSTSASQFTEQSSGNPIMVYVLSEVEMNDSNLPPNRYGFFVRSKDKADNYSVGEPVTEVIVDNEPPCWDFGSNCSLTLTEASGTIDLSSTVDSIGLSAGYKNTISANPVLKYLNCGDQPGEFCDVAFNAATPGGIQSKFILAFTDGPNGSGFDFSSVKNLQFGTGIDVWTNDSQGEAVLWYDDSVASTQILTGLGNRVTVAGGEAVPLNLHLFEGKNPIATYDFNYYENNSPQFDFANIAASNVNRLDFTIDQGRETVRNIYVRLRDMAGNWSDHDFVSSKLIYQTIIVDTHPPRRITQALTLPEIRQGGSLLLTFQENGNSVEYSSDGLATFDTDIQAHPPSNDSDFVLRYAHPIDLSGVEGIWYKFENAPTVYDECSGTDSHCGFIGTTAGQITLQADAAPQNYPVVYVWLKDGSGNPTTQAVPGIQQYYQLSGNPGARCLESAPGIIDYSQSADCRVLRFQLPYDGTRPVFSAGARPFIADMALDEEFPGSTTPTLRLPGAVDNAQGSRESGLRTIDSYKICYSLTNFACDNFFWVSDATGVASEVSFTVPTPLVDGQWYFHAVAYDRAGNESLPSGSKLLTLDSNPPCTFAGEVCDLEVANGATATTQMNPQVEPFATSFGSAVVKMSLAECHENAGNYYATFYTTGGMSASQLIPGPCTSDIDFDTLTTGGTPVISNAIVDYVTNINDFFISAGDGQKYLQVRYQDAGGKWSSIINRPLLLDTTPPAAASLVSIDPAGWSRDSVFNLEITLPQGASEDLSSIGAPNFGINGARYTVDNLPVNNSDPAIKSVPLGDFTYISDGQYKVPITVSGSSGVKNVYFWLEDIPGNHTVNNLFIAQVLYDGHGPVVDSFALSKLPLITTPTLNWSAGIDNESGLKASNTYRVCWSMAVIASDADCTHEAWLNSGTVSYTLAPTEELTQTTWNFRLFTYDNLDNTGASNMIQYLVMSDEPLLTYTGESGYNQRSYYPHDGSSGLYEFRVLYRDANNIAPVKANISIDTNGDGVYSTAEKYTMELENPGTASYVDGAVFRLPVEINMSASSSNTVTYQFDFEHPTKSFQTGTNLLQLQTDYQFEIKSAPVNFDGIIQVRNNVQRPVADAPVTIIFRKPREPGTTINLVVRSRTGLHVRTLLENAPFSSIGRNFIQWDQKDERGQKVGSGLYFIFIQVGSETDNKPVAIVR